MHAGGKPRLRKEHGAKFAGADNADRYRVAGGFAFDQLGMKIHGNAYWQRARDTKVSSLQSAPVVRPDSNALGGQTSAVVMSMLLPPSKPFALHMLTAAAWQSGAPFGAFWHF